MKYFFFKNSTNTYIPDLYTHADRNAEQQKSSSFSISHFFLLHHAVYHSSNQKIKRTKKQEDNQEIFPEINLGVPIKSSLKESS